MQNNQKEIEDKNQLLLMKMKESKLFWKLRSQLLQEVQQKYKNNLQNLNVSEMTKLSQQIGLEESLKQLILNYASKSLKNEPIKNDPLEFINQSRQKWTELILKNYEYVFDKAKTQRKGSEQEEFELLYFYDEANLLTFLTSIKNPTSVNYSVTWNSLIRLNIKMATYQDLKEKFSVLLGNDNIDVNNVSIQEQQTIIKDKEKRARFIVENEALESEIEQFAQGGLPNGERVEIYIKYFCIENNNFAMFYQIEEDLDKGEGLYDLIMGQDSEVSYEDERYFVFQDAICKVLKVFIRDKDVMKKLKIYPQTIDKLPTQDVSKFPPCGFIPNKHFAKYVMPFGYCTQKTEVIYAIFKEFYCRYFCLLNSITSSSNSILGLCIIFEDLFQQTDGRLFQHLVTIQVDPLKIAFPWMFYCFIGFLEIDQLFLLFDRIIGYRNPEIVAVFAVGVFKNKSKQLLNCKSKEDVDEVTKGYLKDNFLDTIKNYFTY